MSKKNKRGVANRALSIDGPELTIRAYSFCEVEGGLVQVDVGQTIEVHTIIFDKDSLESGECPVCMGELDVVKEYPLPNDHRHFREKLSCPECGYHEDDDLFMTIALWQNWRKRENEENNANPS